MGMDFDDDAPSAAEVWAALEHALWHGEVEQIDPVECGLTPFFVANGSVADADFGIDYFIVQTHKPWMN